MKSRQAMILTVGVVSLGGLSVCFAGGRPQPSAPPVPPSFAPNQQPSQQQSPPQGKQSGGSSQSGSGKSNNNNNQNPYGYPYGYPYGNPYGYGQPTGGVYYPGGSPSGTVGNPNGVPQNNANNNNNAPAAGTFPPPDASNNTPANPPAPATPPTPPDPEVIQATADLNAAMDKLRDTLMKTNADYQAAVADKKAAQAETASLRNSDQPVAPETMLAAATRALAAATKVTQIEKAAAATDQAVQDAQSHLKTVMAAHAANAMASK